jgi:hypothetical protein
MKHRSGYGLAVLWAVTALTAVTGCRLHEVSNPPVTAIDVTDGGDAAGADADPPGPGDNPGADGGNRDDVGAGLEAAEITPVDGPLADAAATPTPEVAPEVMPDSLQAGLVGRWRFDEGQGEQAADDVGHNTARLNNGVGWGPGALGAAVRLDGVDDFITAPPTGLPAVEAPKSIALWLGAEPPAAPNEDGQRTCVALYSAEPRAGIQVGLDRGRPAAWFRGADAGFVVAAEVPDGAFHHIAYTFDGQVHRLYVDGTMTAMASETPQTGVVTSLMMGTYQVGREMCAGALDDLRIYDRALTADEARRLAGR